MDRDELITQKRQEYLNYIEEHINNVKKAWSNLISITASQSFLAGFDNSRQLIAITADNIKVHDKSKYSEEEFEPYRRHFHFIDEKEKEDSTAEFEKAWDHHKENNMHHWNWWAKSGNKNIMPVNFIVEMCCDWIAMSMKFGGDAYHWYLKQDDIVLGEQQKEWVINILTKYYGIAR